MSIGFSRMGADLMVVPRDTMVNLTSALLTVEPTPHTLPRGLVDRVAGLDGVDRAAPQRHYRIPLAIGGHLHDVDLIAFDPAVDFTVLPWVADPLERPLAAGEVLIGARRDEAPGTTIQLGGLSLLVRGRLGLTGVGPFDHGLFVTFDTARPLAELSREPESVSAILIRLKVGARPEQVRFAIAQLPEVKVVAGSSMFTSVRQALTALLQGVALFTGLLLAALVLVVSVLYSANLAERRRELGLLLAVGTRRRQLLRMILTEAAYTTGLGGAGGIVLGIVLLLFFQRTLGFYFEEMQVPFAWPALSLMAGFAAACVLSAIAVGLLGAAVPAWRASRRDPFDLIRPEGE